MERKQKKKKGKGSYAFKQGKEVRSRV